MDLTGKTIASVADRRMTGRDTYGDRLRWTETVITFTDGTTASFAQSDGDVYDESPIRFCATCGEELVRVASFGDVPDDDPAAEWTHADDRDEDDDHPARPKP